MTPDLRQLLADLDTALQELEFNFGRRGPAVSIYAARDKIDAAGGTLAYIAELRQRINAALTKEK